MDGNSAVGACKKALILFHEPKLLQANDLKIPLCEMTKKADNHITFDTYPTVANTSTTVTILIIRSLCMDIGRWMEK